MELNFNFIILWGSGNGEGGEDENISRYDRYRLVWDDGFTGVYTYKLHQIISFRYAIIIMLQLHIDKMLELFKIETETSVKENKKKSLISADLPAMSNKSFHLQLHDTSGNFILEIN